MLGADLAAHDVAGTARVIQTALTPVFLLSGIASLLNVFASRLARVSDRSHKLADSLDEASDEARAGLERQLRFFHVRTHLLDASVLLGTFGGGATCMAALLLFVGSLRNGTIAGLLYGCFGLAIICTGGALLSFMVEVLLASRGLRQRQEAIIQRSRGLPAAAPGDAPDAVRPDTRPSS